MTSLTFRPPVQSLVPSFLQRAPVRLNAALLVSLLAHTLLLSMTLGGATFGLPGLTFPWKERRLDASDLQIQLAAAPPTARLDTVPTTMPTPAATAVPQPAATSKLAALTMPSPAIGHSEAAAVVIVPPTPTALPAPPAPATPPAPTLPTQARETPPPGDTDAARKQVDRELQAARALEQARLELERQSAERLRQAALIAAAQREAARQEQLRQDARAEQTASSEAARLEAERQEGLRREAQQEIARHELARTEAARLDAARRDAVRQEQARQAQMESARQAQLESARQAQLEAARQDAVRQESARRDAAKQEAARQDAIAQESARREALKQEPARQEQARAELAQRERADQEAQREERLRAIGKQLAGEAAQRDAAPTPSSRSLLPTVSGLRRGWLFGRADANADLVLYAEAMGRKIQMNMTFDMVREAVKQPHARPIVTVAIRADGSVEKVTFVVSSGVAALDEAIRKVVASQAPYPAFPLSVARQYDVIEIRRAWVFDTAIRLE